MFIIKKEQITIQNWLGENNVLGIDIWKKKYCFEGESFEEWLERISHGNTEIKRLILEKKFLPAGRILSNRGINQKGTRGCYSNCFVLTPPEDNIESIFECAKKMARTFSYGGGVGIDISKLAPRGARVNNAAKETTGAVSFMDLYSLVTGLIGQNNRRGALMISIDCNHPDLEEFVELKSDLDKVTKANISVKITDEFMRAVVEDKDYTLEFTREETGEKITKTVSAKKLFHTFCKMNWDYAEPGILFWDNISSWNIVSHDEEFEYAGTNPCAEEPLPAGGSCLLSSINLSAFVENPFTDKAFFNFDEFSKTTMTLVTFLNEVLDEGVEYLPLQEQKDSATEWRQIGLGIMGLADMLIMLGIRYGSRKSLNVSEEIAEEFINSAVKQSALLAKEHGPYPKCKKDKILKSKFVLHNLSYEVRELIKKYGLRNSQLLTIAPTGTISTMLQISGGIEPIFATHYDRKTESLHGEDKVYRVYTKIVEDYMKAKEIEDIKDLPEFFVTAMDGVIPKERVSMQSIWQRYIDASISSTVNLPYEATVEDVEDIYIKAWQQGLKGITIYRDGCARSGILISDNAKKKKENEEDHKEIVEETKPVRVKQVSNDVIGLKRKLITGCGSLHCTAFFDPHTGDLLETYLSKGSTGGCNNFMVGLSRMISLSARGGISVQDIVDQLMSTGSCPSYAVRSATKRDTSKGACCPMAVGNALLDMYKEMQEKIATGKIIGSGDGNTPSDQPNNPVDESLEESDTIAQPTCPECGEPLVFEGGCNICKACGYSKCD